MSNNTTDRQLIGIMLEGCHETTAFRMELTQHEIELLERVAERSKKYALYTCYPTLIVTTEDVSVESKWGDGKSESYGVQTGWEKP